MLTTSSGSGVKCLRLCCNVLACWHIGLMVDHWCLPIHLKLAEGQYLRKGLLQKGWSEKGAGLRPSQDPCRTYLEAVDSKTCSGQEDSLNGGYNIRKVRRYLVALFCSTKCWHCRMSSVGRLKRNNRKQDETLNWILAQKRETCDLRLSEQYCTNINFLVWISF